MNSRITVAKYPPSKISEYYYSVVDMRKNCFICIHYSAHCDLRQCKRYIVPLEKGGCRLGKIEDLCNSFEKIPELRGKNMNPEEKIYFNMYTRKYLTQVLRRYFHDADIIYNRSKFNIRHENRMISFIAKLEAEKRPKPHKRKK